MVPPTLATGSVTLSRHSGRIAHEQEGLGIQRTGRGRLADGFAGSTPLLPRRPAIPDGGNTIGNGKPRAPSEARAGHQVYAAATSRGIGSAGTLGTSARTQAVFPCRGT